MRSDLKLRLIEEHRGPLHIVRHPEKGRFYSLGCDAAEGVKGGDYSAICLIEMESMEQVAWLHAIMGPRELAQKVCWLGWYYNEAYATIESNSQGSSVVNDVIDIGYPQVYRDITYSNIKRQMSMRPGFRTDRQSRPKLWNNGRWHLKEGHARIHSRVQLREMLAIRYPEDQRLDPQPEHPKGEHDDLTIAWLLAVWGRNVAYQRRVLPEPEPAPLSFEQRHNERLKQEWAEQETDPIPVDDF